MTIKQTPATDKIEYVKYASVYPTQTPGVYIFGERTNCLGQFFGYLEYFGHNPEADLNLPLSPTPLF